MAETGEKVREAESPRALTCAMDQSLPKDQKEERQKDRKRKPEKDAERMKGKEVWEGEEPPKRDEKRERQRERVSEEDVEQLISEACKAAKDYEGRSGTDEASTSYSFHQQVQKAILGLRGSSGGSCTLGQLGDVLCSILEIAVKNDDLPSGSMPKTSNKGLFPLPVTGYPEDIFQSGSFLRALAYGLNSLNGLGLGRSGKTSSNSWRALKRMSAVLQGSKLLQEPIPSLKFEDFFSVKSVDYMGEEIRLARPLLWKSLEPSLPSMVGQLDLRQFCTDGVLYYVNHIDEFLLDPGDQFIGKPPRIMCSPEEWKVVSRGLLERGLCKVCRVAELHHVDSKPLYNGMFSVGKGEYHDDLEITRLIMNLKPCNRVMRSLTADTGTLPSITALSSLYLEDHQLLITSSEDLRCFFYLFRVPEAWSKYFGFGMPLDEELVPEEMKGEDCCLTATVLPMGWLNSVGIAQHVHRNVTKYAMQLHKPFIGGESELRRDRLFPSKDKMFRVYLDNYDELCKVDKATADLLCGTPSSSVEVLRQVYEDNDLPRHPKKTVQQETQAEVQGAWVDGMKGTMTAKPSKVMKYVALALELIGRGKASQRELQVVGGGFVYIAMFKRPLLSALNIIWQKIVECDSLPKSMAVSLGPSLVEEMARFIALLPLAFTDFRKPFDEHVTASDASTTGGGVCVSRGVSPFGAAAATSTVRGDLPEEHDLCPILSIGLFDGISGLRTGLDCLGVSVAGHISCEKQPEARRVVESFFPDTSFIEDIELITDAMVKDWSLRFGSVGLVLLGAGPPCQGVSGLNADRRGALRDHRSKLYVHVRRIKALCRIHFPWAQIQVLIENVASMDHEDYEVMCESFEERAWFIDCAGISLCRRPRLYWVSWELREDEGVQFSSPERCKLLVKGEVELWAEISPSDYLEPGWHMDDLQRLPTFTTARPSSVPLRRPAGLKTCQPHELEKWQADSHRFPPYQYKDENGVWNRAGEIRIPSVLEREVILGFPSNFTKQCMVKSAHGTVAHKDCRLSLLGNSWSVPVVSWLLSQLLMTLGLIEPISLQQLVDRFRPGHSPSLQGMLLRPPVGASTKTLPLSQVLVQKLCTMGSLKGEDILLQGASEVPVRYHRLRASIPARLWRWRTVAGWSWGGNPEHINVLELRSVLTSVKWRVENLSQANLRCVHLVDSLVVLHALTRGRSSSRKMRRTLMRISSYLLVSGLQPLWAYVDTKQNPADAPSRRGVKKQWVKKLRK